MSLINRMLQDLDSRGTESMGKGAMYAQIRSVPEEHKRQPLRWLWWFVPAACIVAVAAWQWPRSADIPAPVAGSPMQIAQMDLKLSSELSVVQASLLQSPVEKTEEGRINTVPTGADPKQDGGERTAKAALMVPANESAKAAASNMPAAYASGIPADFPLPAKEQPPAALGKTTDVPPMSINKQVKELTVQQRAENEYRKALLLIQQGRPLDAIAGLEQALNLDRHMVSARQTLAGVLIDANRLEEAMRRLQEGLSIDPAQAGMAMILARLQVERGDLRPALETLQRTLPHAADRADYQAFLAALLQRDGHHKEAIDHYVQALQQNPQNGVWWMGLGISLQADNQLPEAYKAFARAKASNALSPELQAFVNQKLNQLKQ